MKLKDSEKAILLVLFGIAACALAVIYVAKPNFDERQSLENEAAQLAVRLSELQAKQADREKYEAGIVEYTEKFETLLNAFPPDMKQEISIMFLQGIKDSNDFTISSLGLGEKSSFYTLGSGGSDESLPGAEADTADTAEGTGLVESGSGTGEGEMVCYQAQFPISYTGSYKSLKDVVEYIDSYSDRMTVDTLDIRYSGDNTYSGTLQLTCYSIEGETRPERNLDLEQVEIGVDNIFEGGGSGSGASSLAKYDDTEGNAIETSYDFYVMLNPSTSDVSAKVIGQNGTGKENTVISDSENTTSTISYNIYEVDGKNYCKYTLDGGQSYEAEITSAEDVKLLIQSSARKNDEDKVGVMITINNSTSMPVYVKVSGDDAVSPRVTVSRTGLVKVYQ